MAGDLGEIFVWRDEYDRQDMPCACMRCGKKKARWMAWSFQKPDFKNGRRVRVFRKTEVPLCSEHANMFTQITASDYNATGVWTLNVHKDFRAALKKHRKAEVAAWKEENPDADPDDIDDEKLPPGLRQVPKNKKQPLAKIRLSWGWIIAIVAVLAGIPMLACLATLGMGILGIAVSVKK